MIDWSLFNWIHRLKCCVNFQPSRLEWINAGLFDSMTVGCRDRPRERIDDFFWKNKNAKNIYWNYFVQRILTIFTQAIFGMASNSSLCQLTMNETRRFFFFFFSHCDFVACPSSVPGGSWPQKCGTRTIMLMTSYLDMYIAKCFNLLIIQI